MIAYKKNNTPILIKKMAFCGSLESSDVLVTIEPNTEKKINIFIKSPFIRQFGKRIKKVALETLDNFNIEQCNLIIQDQGAIDAVLVARLITAFNRAS
ncbi:citrate lyase acyl carrier protein [Candidatus Phytoplasma prunorum]|uniref:citrate lyase acyl carrier protein n=1 Tax=Candidatus Phytoplasma prunorum TaxID=47565 RepID=UPI002FF13652